MEISGKKGRSLSGSLGLLVFIISIAFSLYQLYFLSYGALPPLMFRSIHLMFVLILVFLLTPASKKSKMNSISILDVIFALSGIFVTLYILSDYENFITRCGVSPTTFDIIVGLIAIFLVLEAARRSFGLPLPIVAIVFILYAMFGNYIPGLFTIPEYSFSRIFSYIFSSMGIYGVALATSATYVFLFVLFGSFLLHSGVGDVFTKIVTGLTGKYRGGPAKVAIFSSGIFGSISGSASSNVVTTGSFTIPLMKKVGYDATYAASIETAASIGGLFMPPIMGSGGFLMAQILGIPYLEVIKAAFIPAVLYYFALYILIDFEALRLNLKGMSEELLPDVKKVLKETWHLLIPFFVLLYLLIIVRQSAVRAAIWSIAFTIIVPQLRKNTRIPFSKLFTILSSGATKAITVSAATACAGIIVGVVSMTGLGLTFTAVMINIAGTTVLLALVLTMIVAIIMGMGLPITATYITSAAILGPALINLGFFPLGVHLFIYFFAAVSGMTPPVCVTAYAASGISEADPIDIGFTSIRLGWVAFVLPFMFIFNSALLFQGPIQIVLFEAILAFFAVIIIAGAIKGRLFNLLLNNPLRILLTIVGLFNLAPTSLYIKSIMAVGTLFLLYSYVKFYNGNSKEKSA